MVKRASMTCADGRATGTGPRENVRWSGSGEALVGRVTSDGAVTTFQSADVALPRAELERIWTPEYLERLARTYWRFLERVSLGLLRVLYPPGAREVVLARRPLVLLRFKAPEYDLAPDHGAVLWRIDRGLLVTPRGRGKGFEDRGEKDREPERAERRRRQAHGHRRGVELLSDAPRLRLVLFVGRFIYRFTQQRIHVIVTKAFLRSLARLDLVPSVVGQLTEGGGNGSADGA